MGDDKKVDNHKQYEELQQLLKNLGITTKYSRITEQDKKKADKLFPE